MTENLEIESEAGHRPRMSKTEYYEEPRTKLLKMI